jgi:chromate transporter
LANTAPARERPQEPVTFRDALRVWVRVGLQSFGGPAGQIAVMHRILVDEKRWVTEHRFLHALNYCMLLPGPEAQQLATYLGWLFHGYRGGLVAGSLFVLPGFLSILALSYVYAAFQGVGAVAAAFFGLKAAVLAIVVEALLRIGRRALGTPVTLTVAALAFAGIFAFHVPFPLIVLGAGLLGLIGGVFFPEVFAAARPEAGAENASGGEPLEPGRAAHTRPSVRRALGVLFLFSSLWLAPIAILAWAFGPASVFVVEATFFSKAAVVTFGGAYAVLAYIAQQAVERYGWLLPGEMLDGLGLAETTPGPLIMVVQFVGFLGAYRNPGALHPMAAGTLGAVVTTWVTFMPCFLWIFLGAPYVELLRGRRELSAALSAVTAAVCGVILNLAVWFALHVMFGEIAEGRGPLGLRWIAPVWKSVDPAAVAISGAAFVALMRLRAPMLAVLGASAVAGVLFRLAG